MARTYKALVSPSWRHENALRIRPTSGTGKSERTVQGDAERGETFYFTQSRLRRFETSVPNRPVPRGCSIAGARWATPVIGERHSFENVRPRP
jgi:hypothetical protein